MGAPINYRELLKKYIKHVEECEGINFIDSWEGDFSDDEAKELTKLSEEK